LWPSPAARGPQARPLRRLAAPVRPGDRGMKRPLKIALSGLMLALLAGLGLFVADRLQPYQETVRHGPSPEARANEYLAAELFLRQQRIELRRADGLEVLTELPAAAQTLMLFAPRHNMTPRQAEKVLAWAAEGGHLVFVAEEIWDEEQGRSGDLLLDALGVQQYETYDYEEDDQSAEEDAQQATEAEDPHAEEGTGEAASDEEDDTEEEDRYPELTKIYLENEDAPAYV